MPNTARTHTDGGAVMRRTGFAEERHYRRPSRSFKSVDPLLRPSLHFRYTWMDRGPPSGLVQKGSIRQPLWPTINNDSNFLKIRNSSPSTISSTKSQNRQIFFGRSNSMSNSIARHSRHGGTRVTRLKCLAGRQCWMAKPQPISTPCCSNTSCKEERSCLKILSQPFR